MPEELGQQPVVLSGDSRLVELGITERLQQECNAVVWDPARGSENITQAEQANVGVVYAEYGLTESGGVVLFSAPERGRSLSLLPESSIFVLRKSTILPRVAQLMQPAPRASAVCKDPDDQVFIDLAMHVGARWLFSKDAALLKLNKRSFRLKGVQVLRLTDWPGWVETAEQMSP